MDSSYNLLARYFCSMLERQFFSLLVFLLIGFFLDQNRVYGDYWEVTEPNNIEISFLTIGPGDQLYTSGGHTALRVFDKKTQKDLLYNWGIFDFHTEYFLLKFYRETLPYQFYFLPTKNFLYNMSQQSRWVIQNQLYFTPQQKQILLGKLNWWHLPENREYIYHIYQNNCSTQVRDIIDSATGGQLKNWLVQQRSDWTLRGLLKHTLANWPWTYALADLAANKSIDGELNLWSEGFLPFQLHRSLKSVPSFDLNPQSQRNLLLLGPDEKLVQGQEPSIDFLPIEPFFLAFIFLLVAAYLRNSFIFLRFVMVGYGALAGIFALLCLGTYLITQRTYLYFPVTLAFLWPTDFFISWLVWKKRLISKKQRKFFYYYSIGHLVVMALTVAMSFINVNTVSKIQYAAAVLSGMLNGLVLVILARKSESFFKYDATPKIFNRSGDVSQKQKCRRKVSI